MLDVSEDAVGPCYILVLRRGKEDIPGEGVRKWKG